MDSIGPETLLTASKTMMSRQKAEQEKEKLRQIQTAAGASQTDRAPCKAPGPEFMLKWSKTIACGRPIPGTFVVVGKAPLAGTDWSVDKMLKHFTKCGLKIEGVINMSGAQCVQGADDWLEHGIPCYSIPFYGRRFPTKEMIDSMVSHLHIENDRMRRMEANSPLTPIVYIHCTRGVDRSAYIVCEFLKKHLNYSGPGALKAVEENRGNAVENIQLCFAICNGWQMMLKEYPGRKYDHSKMDEVPENHRQKKMIRQMQRASQYSLIDLDREADTVTDGPEKEDHSIFK